MLANIFAYVRLYSLRMTTLLASGIMHTSLCYDLAPSKLPANLEQASRYNKTYMDRILHPSFDNHTHSVVSIFIFVYWMET